MAFLTALNEFFNSGDPIVLSFPLVRSYWHPFALSALYVFVVKRLGPFLMKNRKPFDLRIPMIIYNFSLVFVYFTCICIFLYNAFVQPDAFQAICSYLPVKANHYSYQCVSAAWYLYIMKYVEFADTIFFILRKKDHLITNLHVIHHAALPIIAWVLMRTETNGVQFIPGGVNSFIHIIMYTYYGLAAMGPEVQKKLWWKEHLTILQMAQFVLIIFFMFVVVPLSGCRTTSVGPVMIVIFAILFLALFYNYYRKTYKVKADKSACNKPNGVYVRNGFHAKEN